VERCWFYSCGEELSGSGNHLNASRDHETTSPENRFRIVRSFQLVDRGRIGVEGV
jgi:hypothetical protein